MIKCYIFTRRSQSNNYHGKLMWKGEIAQLPPVGYSLAINGVVHAVESATYDIAENMVEIHLDFLDVHNEYEELKFDND